MPQLVRSLQLTYWQYFYDVNSERSKADGSAIKNKHRFRFIKKLSSLAKNAIKIFQHYITKFSFRTEIKFFSGNLWETNLTFFYHPTTF